MQLTSNSPQYDDAKDRIALSTIGFMSIPQSGSGSKPSCAGSGTLVRLGDTTGVITAAHVLEELGKFQEIGLVQFAQRPEREQRTKVLMNYVKSLPLGEPPWTIDGPDIGFLSLPHDVVGSLEAVGCVFINLERHGSELLKAADNYPGFYCIAGAIGERSQTSVSPSSRRFDAHLEASVEPGDVSERPSSNEFDYIDFVSQRDEGNYSPESYKGMSGGGLWITYRDSQKDESKASYRTLFCGVNFWQSAATENGRTIACHHLRSIYEHLVPAVRKAFS